MHPFLPILIQPAEPGKSLLFLRLIRNWFCCKHDSPPIQNSMAVVADKADLDRLGAKRIHDGVHFGERVAVAAGSKRQHARVLGRT